MLRFPGFGSRSELLGPLLHTVALVRAAPRLLNLVVKELGTRFPIQTMKRKDLLR